MKKTSVLLVDDYTVVRQGLKSLLETKPDIAVVGEADTGPQAVQLARELHAQVVIMGIVMPVLNGVAATRQILREAPGTKIIALSSCSDEQYLRELIEAGAAAYLLRQTDAAGLIKAVRDTQPRRTFFGPAISRRLAEHYHRVFPSANPARRRTEALTARELEVLQLIAEGQASKQIAGGLFISIKTVVKHRQQVMNKLNIHNVAGLTRCAIAEGIIKAVPDYDYAAA